MATLTHRRWLQFSLRSTLDLLTVFGIWLGVQVNRAERQRRAVAVIEGLGGEVQYDWEYSEEERAFVEDDQSREVEAPGPAWLRDLLGDHYVDTVVAVYLRRLPPPGEHSVFDADLRCLPDLPKLEAVSLSHQPITNKGLKQLAQLKRIRGLELYGTATSDACLDDILELHDLEWLDVGDTRVTVKGLSRLLEMPNLKGLFISKAQTSAAGGWDEVTKALPGVDVYEVFESPSGGGSATNRPIGAN